MDAEALKLVLRELGDLLPSVPEGMAALTAETDALALETAALLEATQARQVEAADLLGRIEAAMAALRATAAAQAAALGHRAPGELEDPALGFRTAVSEPALESLRREDAARAELEAGAARLRDEHGPALEAAAAGVDATAQEASRQVAAAAEQVLMGATTLQATVAELRRAGREAAERLGAAIEEEAARGARDLDEMARDLAALEATLVAALQRTGDLVHADAERVHAETAQRLGALAEAVDRALEEAGDALRELHEFLHGAERDSTEARQALEPRFDELESRLGPLKQAVESVRDAASSVGLAF